MATFHATIQPVKVPQFVQIRIGNQEVDIPIEDLTEEQLTELAEEFTKNLFSSAGKPI